MSVVNALADASVWPSVHFFMPALVFVYVDFHIFKLLSIIYLFESVEYLLGGLLPILEESSMLDKMVFDILMGLLGSATIYGVAHGASAKPPTLHTGIKITHVVVLSTLHTFIVTQCDSETSACAFIWYMILYSGSVASLGVWCKSSLLQLWAAYAFVAYLVIMGGVFLVPGYTTVVVVCSTIMLLGLTYILHGTQDDHDVAPLTLHRAKRSFSSTTA